MKKKTNKKTKQKNNAKLKKSKPNIQKTTRKRRSINEGKVSKGNNKRTKEPKPISKNTLVSKKQPKQSRKRTESIRPQPKGIRSKKSNKTKKPLVLQFKRRNKKSPSDKTLKTFDNVFEIHLHGQDLQAKISALNSWNGKELKPYNRNFRRLPRAFQIILQTKKGNKVFETANKISPPDMFASNENIKMLIIQAIQDFQENFFDVLDVDEPANSDWVFDPKRISKIFIRFFYA